MSRRSRHIAFRRARRRPQIFAVLQWEREDGITEEQAAEKLEDLDFAAVVRATEAFVLVGTHVEAVAQLSQVDMLAKKVPDDAKHAELAALCAAARAAQRPKSAELAFELAQKRVEKRRIVSIARKAKATGRGNEPARSVECGPCTGELPSPSGTE